jgi:hypothetical protein
MISKMNQRTCLTGEVHSLIVVILLAFGSLSLVSCQKAQEELPKHESLAVVPESMNYSFRLGFPEGDTAKSIYRNSDLRRAIEAYKTLLPTLATEAVIQQMMAAGAKPNEVGIVMAQGPKQQFAATNSDTPYALTTLDLRQAGPMVIEMPPNQLLIGFVNDHNMRWITDTGSIGPEKGEGGKHLILPPGHEGVIPNGYYVSRSKTWLVVSAIRTVPFDGDVQKAISAVHDIKIYPLSKAGEPVEHRYIDVTEKRLPLPLLDWEGTFEYWRQVHAIIQHEYPQVENRYTMGALAELGIEQDKPFDPTPESRELLAEAAKIAHEELSISLYANRRPFRISWEGQQWESIPVGTMHLATGDLGTASKIDLDAYDQYFFFGWGTSSAIGRKEVGAGSIYFTTFKDQSGSYLDGGENYKMTIPGPVPSNLFWSTTVYDAYTRCLIETPLDRAAVRSHLDNPKANSDGSYDIYFGPKAPDGLENNWVQTIPDKGWFPMVRIYGPKVEAFDGSWKLSEITKVK